MTDRITVTTFLDDDAAYAAWYRAHEHLGWYVLNVTPAERRVVLHRNPCGYIAPWQPSGDATYRATANAKVASNSWRALQALAPISGLYLINCTRCRPYETDAQRYGNEKAWDMVLHEIEP